MSDGQFTWSKMILDDKEDSEEQAVPPQVRWRALFICVVASSAFTLFGYWADGLETDSPLFYLGAFVTNLCSVLLVLRPRTDIQLSEELQTRRTLKKTENRSAGEEQLFEDTKSANREQKLELQRAQGKVERLLENLEQSRMEAQAAQQRFEAKNEELAMQRLAAMNIAADERLAREDLEQTQLELAAQADELKQALHEARRSNSELEQFAYVASHDLQEPLRMISSYTKLLQRDYQGKLGSQADEYIRFATEAAKRMQTLIKDLLELSRVGTRGKIVTVNTSEIVANVLEDLGESLREQKVSIQLGGLPRVKGVQVQLSQLFHNLIGNALKFRSSKPLEISIGATPSDENDNEWVFFVADNGIGFDSEVADQVFLMFQRLHQRDEYQGSGVGLAIAKKIVEHHGGRIWVESQSGVGSTFYFTLTNQNVAYEVKAA